MNEKSNQLANYLRQFGVGPDTFVAIALERSVEMMIGVLGVLKAGGAYVPLDPNYPQNRLQLILDDTNAPIIITDSNIIDKIPSTLAQSICLEDVWDSKDLSSANLDLLNSKSNLAYIIYTSGSTGKPKGVLIEHQNLINSINARLSYYTNPVQSFLLLSSIAFDSSIAGIFWPLVQGGTLVLPEEDVQYNPNEIINIINQQAVSHILCVPSLYRALLAQAKEDDLHSLQTVIVAGESCSDKLAMEHSRLLQDTHLFNEYGPTEATVWSSV